MSVVKIGVELLLLCWVKEGGIVVGLLKALLEAGNTSKIVMQIGIKTCTADIGVCDIRMVLKGRLVIYR